MSSTYLAFRMSFPNLVGLAEPQREQMGTYSPASFTSIGFTDAA